MVSTTKALRHKAQNCLGFRYLGGLCNSISSLTNDFMYLGFFYMNPSDRPKIFILKLKIGL